MESPNHKTLLPSLSAPEPRGDSQFHWLRTGEQGLAEMLAAINAATNSVRLEMYIFHDGPVAERFRQTLVNACQRGLRVQVLIDAMGSISLPDSFWDLFRVSGGDFRWFNPLTLNRFWIRDHRKILVCDGTVAFIGGFNIATEYCGDGVTSGWRDLGMRLTGSLTQELAVAFDEMFACADFKHQPFARLRKSQRQRLVEAPEGELLLSGPGRNNPVKRALRNDLKKARRVQIICAYFLPPWRMRRDLMRVARRGGQVQLILAAKTDVPMTRLAAQSFYRRLLRAGVEIYEYQPQILHAKLFLIDDAVYVGSANLDTRSLNINYELLVRLKNAKLAAEGRGFFLADLAHCRKIEFANWRKSRSLWERIKARWAYFILARLDPTIARRQWKILWK